MSVFTDFLGAQAQFNPTFAPVALTGKSVMRWSGDIANAIPMFIGSGEFNCGMPDQRKFFDYLEFHGDGTAQIRVYLDGTFVTQSTLVAMEGSPIQRRVNLPTGSRGYGVRFELVGAYSLRGVELAFRPFPGAGSS